MAKFFSILSIALAMALLLLAGCAGTAKDDGSAKGKVVVTVLYTVSGCGIHLPGDNTSNCGSGPSKPYPGQVMVKATDITGINMSAENAFQIFENRTVLLGTFNANQSGEIELELPAGDYYLTLYKQNTTQYGGIETKTFKIEPDKPSRVVADFVYYLP